MNKFAYGVMLMASLFLNSCGNSSGGSITSVTFSITGTVTSNGAALSGVNINLTGVSGASTITASNGNYSFEGLMNGSYTIAPSLAGYSFNPASIVVSVSDANMVGNNFTATTATATYSISGTVTGASGVMITLSGANNGYVLTGTGGDYLISGLAPGNYTVMPSLSGYTFSPTSSPVTITTANSTANNFVAALTVPANVSAIARDSNNLISWDAVSGATSYNIYWSIVSGVTKLNGSKITLANNPQAHTGLVNGTSYYYVVTTLSAGGESAESAEVSATPAAVTAIADPLYADQWHLKNIGQKGANNKAGISGEDIDVEPAWAMIDSTSNLIKGDGVRIAVVDDGLEIGHEDLVANVAANNLSYNYFTGSTDPSYDPTDSASGHGTEVAGIAAARDMNGLGGRGVAPHANLVAYNLLQYDTISNEADAMVRGLSGVAIYTNSWGAPDGTGTLAPSELSWRSAIDNGVTNGCNGQGTIYTWAAGNGGNGSGPPIDNSNYDGQANYRGVIAVTSVNDQGKQSSYAEPGANIWVSAPGGEYCDSHAITTTDRTGTVGDNSYNDSLYGYATLDYPDNNYTKCMNGTSAAAPTAAGVIALMLQANPNLTERDVRLILAQSARQNDPTDPGWNPGGVTAYHFNHKYGFGVIDAAAAVTLASAWSNVAPQVISSTYSYSPNLKIPDATQSSPQAAVVPGAARTDTINIANSNITSIEYIEITFSAADHPYAGDLAITLTSPSGTTSTLAESHSCYDANWNWLASCPPYSAWVFGSARHLGEIADGNWTLSVQDGGPGDTGTFQSWSLKFYGH